MLKCIIKTANQQSNKHQTHTRPDASSDLWHKSGWLVSCGNSNKGGRGGLCEGQLKRIVCCRSVRSDPDTRHHRSELERRMQNNPSRLTVMECVSTHTHRANSELTLQWIMGFSCYSASLSSTNGSPQNTAV